MCDELKLEVSDPNCPCAAASDAEQEIATVPGREPGTAFTVRVAAGREGYLRIEQRRYSPAMGWYTQKSFCIPAEVAHALIPELRKAACVLPRQRPGFIDDAPLRFTPGLPPGSTPGLPTATPEAPAYPVRRDA